MHADEVGLSDKLPQLSDTVLLLDPGLDPSSRVAELLTRHGIFVETAASVEASRAKAGEGPTVVLLNAPTDELVEACHRVVEDRSLRGASLLVLLPEEFEDGSRVFHAGAADVIRQPYLDEELVARVSTHVLARRNQRSAGRDGSELEEEKRTRDVLLRSIAHDIRSPLTSIMATLSFLEEDLGAALPEENAEDVKQAKIAARRLTELSRQVLDLARLDGTQQEELPRGQTKVETLVDALKADLSAKGEGRIEFTVDRPEGEVHCDGDLLRRVLAALVYSAQKNAPPESVIHVRFLQLDLGVRIEVEDEGPGLSEQDQAQMFEPRGPLKLKLRGVGRSAGIRLEFCRLAVAALGGRIGVVSRGRTGACFWLEVPRAP